MLYRVELQYAISVFSFLVENLNESHVTYQLLGNVELNLVSLFPKMAKIASHYNNYEKGFENVGINMHLILIGHIYMILTQICFHITLILLSLRIF